MDKILTILGSTSTGKTDLGLSLAKKFNGELVSCDSRQIYQDLDIGSGKLPNEKNVKVVKGDRFWEMNGIKVWMYDMADPRKSYTVFNFIQDATKVIRDIEKRGKLPIIVGGTGLYLKALTEGLSNLGIPIDKNLRERLSSKTTLQLQAELKRLGPAIWQRMNFSDRQNPRRLIRQIEIAESKNLNPTANYQLSTANCLKIGLTAPRKVLYQRADQRVVERINQGMIDEAKRLYQRGLSLARMRQLGLEFGVLADYLEGKIKTRAELIAKLQYRIHDFIRRQQTWFKKDTSIRWFDISQENFLPRLEKLIALWYDAKDASQD